MCPDTPFVFGRDPASTTHHHHPRRGLPPLLHGEGALLEGDVLPSQPIPAEQLGKHARRGAGNAPPLLVGAIHENIHLSAVVGSFGVRRAGGQATGTLERWSGIHYETHGSFQHGSMASFSVAWGSSESDSPPFNRVNLSRTCLSTPLHPQFSW